jgi:energy-coupling factor transporter transmembrane protein EcfT
MATKIKEKPSLPRIFFVLLIILLIGVITKFDIVLMIFISVIVFILGKLIKIALRGTW